MAKVSARTIEEHVNAMITQGKKNGNVLSHLLKWGTTFRN